SRRRHTRFSRDWSSDVCSSDLIIYLTSQKFNHMEEQLLKICTLQIAWLFMLKVHMKQRWGYIVSFQNFLVLRKKKRRILNLLQQIGRASCREECRCREGMRSEH